jgi:hypothetical protein
VRVAAVAVVSVALAAAGSPLASAALPTQTAGCSGPFLAKAPGELPSPGPGRTLLGVELPAGGRGPNGEYWVSHEPVDDPQRLWVGLAERFGETGLWPVLSDFPSQLLLDPYAEWEDPSTLDAEVVLGDLWRLMGIDDDVAEVVGGGFPGLADRQPVCVHNIAESRLFDLPLESHLLLVPVTRPADVVHRLGSWIGFATPSEMSAVFRSWEDRFGMFLLVMEGSYLIMGIERPPKDPASRERFWAELIAIDPSVVPVNWEHDDLDDPVDDIIYLRFQPR